MVKKLVSKAEFARVAGVTQAAISKAIANGVAAAMEGKRIDLNHEAARKYLASREAEEVPATGVDSMYEDAIRHCRANHRYTVSNIARGLKIGFARAKKIFALMQAAGVDKPPAPEELAKPIIRGTAAAKAKMKQAPPPLPIDPDEYLLEVPEDIRAFADMSLRQLVERFGTDTRFVDWLSATKRIEDINGLRLKNSATEGTLISRQLVKTGVIDVFDSAHRRLMTDGAKSIAAGVKSKVASGASLDEVEAYVADIVGSFLRPTKNKIARTLKNVKA